MMTSKVSSHLTKDNIKDAHNAMRDILFLYRELALHGLEDCQSGYICIDAHTGNFDLFNYLRCDKKWLIPKNGVATLDVDIDLLQQGSAVALIAAIIDHIEGASELPSLFLQKLDALITSGKLDHLPTAREAVLAFFQNPTAFDEKCRDVYLDYVANYFKKMASGAWLAPKLTLSNTVTSKEKVGLNNRRIINIVDGDDFRSIRETQGAMRDILFFYHQMVRHTAEDPQNSHTCTDTDLSFDLLKYILRDEEWLSSTTSPEGYEIDIDLLQEGAAVALIAKLSNHTLGTCKLDTSFLQAVEELATSGRLDHLPVALEALFAFLQNSETFQDRCQNVYTAYTVNYFKEVLSGKWKERQAARSDAYCERGGRSM